MLYFKRKINELITRCKNLEGDPHFISMGMGVGVFVCATPTFPFQTFLAIGLSFILRASKAAAIIGSIIAVPIIPFCYAGSYKIGMFFLGKPSSADFKSQSISDLFTTGIDIAIAMLGAGSIIGLVFGIAAYVVTKKIYANIQRKHQH
jgi:uncharacterized protein (DUF2062 family)